MKDSELLKNFNGFVDSFEERQGFITKAKSQAKKFKPEVIEKVVADHEAKAQEIASNVIPLIPELEGGVVDLELELGSIEDEKGGIDSEMEELELRNAIGELADDAFAEKSKDLRKSQGELEKKLKALTKDKGALEGALKRWGDLADAAGFVAEQKEPEPEPEPEPEADDPPEKAINRLEYDEPMVMDEPVVVDDRAEEPGRVNRETILGGMREDVSAVFENRPAEAAAHALDDEEEIEAIAAGAVEEEESDNGWGAEEEVIPDADEDELVLEPNAVEEPVVEEDAPDGDDGEDRRALLLYQEGTAEEQIYPFTGDVITIGRGRDNDIQIKNDSKVSRFHCKLYRKGNNFYIEDNKSSNGSLVNGELITERRLFGGEELIIGETFFRFRIM